MKKEKLLFVVPHPDDMALCCSGTAWRLKDIFQIVVVCMTRGETYSPKRPELTTYSERAQARTAEELAANAPLNAETIFFGAVDGAVYASPENCSKMAEFMKEYQFKAIFAPWPVDWHPDHTASCEIVRKAIHLSKTTAELYFFEESGSTNFIPDIRVDISCCFEQKKAMISAHKTQEIEERLLDLTHVRNAHRGAEAGTVYAEGFKRYRPLIAGKNDFLMEIFK